MAETRPTQETLSEISTDPSFLKVSKATLCLHLLTSDATPNSPNRSHSPIYVHLLSLLAIHCDQHQIFCTIMSHDVFFWSALACHTLADQDSRF